MNTPKPEWDDPPEPESAEDRADRIEAEKQDQAYDDWVSREDE